MFSQSCYLCLSQANPETKYRLQTKYSPIPQGYYAFVGGDFKY